MAFYDANSAIQPVNALQAFMGGAQAGQAMQDLRRKRAQEAQDEEIRNGLMQFYRQATPATNVVGVNSLDALRDGKPAQPGGLDYQGATDYLNSRGRFEDAGALAKLREQFTPQMAKFFGGNAQEVARPDGSRALIAMTDRGAVELPYAPVSSPEAPKTRTVKFGTRELTQEWDGRQWRTIADAPRDVPEPVRPQLVTTTEGFEVVYPGQAPKGKPVTSAAGAEPTEGERKAGAATLVMNNAEQKFSAANNGQGMTTKGYYASKFKGGDYLMSKADQKARQSMVDWYREKLRLESGATIGDEEAYEEAKRYFPVPGDDPETIKQKADGRSVVMQGLSLKAGRAAKPAAPAAASGWSITKE